MEEPLFIQDGLSIPGAELQFTASRAGGPGGQHVNKTSSRVTLCWNLRDTAALDPVLKARALACLENRLTKDGVLQVHAESSRSQKHNLEDARARLAQLIRGAVAEKKKRIPTKTTKSAQRRRLTEKSRRSEVKRLRKDPAVDD